MSPAIVKRGRDGLERLGTRAGSGQPTQVTHVEADPSLTVTGGKKRGRNGWKGVETEVGAGENTQATHKEADSSLTSMGKKKRGRTCLQVMATGEKERKLVEWNARGQPIGDVSIKFSSTIGVIVREQVPITIDTWHGVEDVARDNLWKLLMQKYIVDICYKPFILQQMGKLWRSWKSDLSVDIREIEESKSTKAERINLLAKLRPKDVSVVEWDIFVQSRMTDEWQEKSKKMRAIRAKQTITHTMSREGYARLEDKHNKKHPEKPLTKPALWIKGHEPKKCKNPVVAAKIAEVQSKMNESPPTEQDPNQEEILTQVLGKDRPGRVRGLGAGVTKTKLRAQRQSDSNLDCLKAALNKQAKRTKKLEDLIAAKLGISLDLLDSDDDDLDKSGKYAAEEHAPVLSKNQVQASATLEEVVTRRSGEGSTQQPSLHDKCKLLNWNGNGEVVAIASVSAIDPKSKVHGFTLGPDCYRVFIDEVLVERAEFYRTEPEFANLDDALGSTIAWPIKYIVFDDE